MSREWSTIWEDHAPWNVCDSPIEFSVDKVPESSKENSHGSTKNNTANNFSFEYKLDAQGTKFLKVYNEHSYEDIFEGEIVKTGIGFSYRKSYKTLKDIWKRKGKSNRKNKKK